MPVRHGNATGLRGHSHHHKGDSGKTGVEERDWYQSWQEGRQGPGLSSAPPGFHTWEQKLTLFGTAAWSHTHKQGLEGLHFLPESVGEKAHQRLSFYFQGPSRTWQKWRRKVRADQHPHGCQGSWGWINWKPRHFLILRDPAFLNWGYYSLVQAERELALGGRTCSSEGHSRAGPGWAVSVGNGGLQLLQATPAEFCSIRLSILRKLLRSAH